MMRVVGLLSWYDEPAEMLYESVASLAPHISHLVAFDGAYQGFPDAHPFSPRDQYHAIQDACHDHGCVWDIHMPHGLWDNEIQKRSEMFRFAEKLTDPATDWYIVWDADMVMAWCDHLWEDLGWASEESASFLLLSSEESREPPRLTHRMAHRAIRGLTVIEFHSVYGYPHQGGWRYVWGHEQAPPALDLSKTVAVHHRPEMRGPERLARKLAFDEIVLRS